MNLTLSELELLKLYVQGRTNDQIERELGLSPQKMSIHLRHLIFEMKKLGNGLESEDLALMIRKGLIERQRLAA